MELLTNNPGLQFLAEEIFLNLNWKELAQKCVHVNDSWKSIIHNPTFLLQLCIRDYGQLFQENESAWKKELQLTKKDTDLKENFTQYLKNMLDLPPLKFHRSCAYVKLGLD